MRFLFRKVYFFIVNNFFLAGSCIFLEREDAFPAEMPFSPVQPYFPSLQIFFSETSDVFSRKMSVLSQVPNLISPLQVIAGAGF